MSNSPSESFSLVTSYEQSMYKMRFLLRLLVLIAVALSMSDKLLNLQFFMWINTGIPHAIPTSLLPMWDVTLNTLTYMGDTHVMLWLIFLINLPWLMTEGRKSPDKLSQYLVAFALVLVIATIVSQSLKEIVGALRPAGVLPGESLRILGKTLVYHSFPSGHTITAFVGMCLLLPVIPGSWGWGVLALAAAIGFSRIGVGAHWPIDVVAGAFLGIVSSMMGWRISFWLQQKGLAENNVWKKIYRGLAKLGITIIALNIVYTPFYELEHRSIRLGLIGLFLILTLSFGYYRKNKLK